MEVYLFPFTSATKLHFFLGVFLHFITGDDNILAALDKVQIAEELSKVALAEIIVPVAVYAFKSGVENLSKNNRWPDKGDTPEAEPEDTDPPGMG